MTNNRQTVPQTNPQPTSKVVMDNTLREVIFGPMRLPFLLLTPACVMLAAATAAWSGSPLNCSYLALPFIGAVAAALSLKIPPSLTWD